MCLCARVCSPLHHRDCKCEPAPGQPYPPAQRSTDRWFEFRRWYHSAPFAATRRQFLHAKIRGMCSVVQHAGWSFWRRIYDSRLVVAQNTFALTGGGGSGVQPHQGSKFLRQCRAGGRGEGGRGGGGILS
jgi:hypothetical protein